MNTRLRRRWAGVVLTALTSTLVPVLAATPAAAMVSDQDKISTVATGRDPESVAAAPSGAFGGSVFYLDGDTDIRRIAPDGTDTLFETLNDDVTDLVVTDTHVWASATSGYIYRISADGTLTWITDGAGSGPVRGIAVSSDDVVYAVESAPVHALYRWDGSDGSWDKTLVFGNPGSFPDDCNTELADPYDIALSTGETQVYVAEAGGHMVTWVYANGASQSDPNGPLKNHVAGVCGSGPGASSLPFVDTVELGSDGTVYAEAGNRIFRLAGGTAHLLGGTVAATADFAIDGGDGGWLSQATFDNPMDLAISPNDVMYVADNGNGRLRRVGEEPSTLTVEADVTVGEEEGQVEVALLLDRPASTDVTVEIDTMDGSAEAGDDYTALDAEVVTIEAGDMVGSVTVEITDDGDDERTDLFWVNASNIAGAVLDADADQSVVAIDDDDRGALTFTDANGGTLFDGDTVNLRLDDYAADTNTGAVNTVTATVTTTADPDGFGVTLTETGVTTARFAGSFTVDGDDFDSVTVTVPHEGDDYTVTKIVGVYGMCGAGGQRCIESFTVNGGATTGYDLMAFETDEGIAYGVYTEDGEVDLGAAALSRSFAFDINIGAIDVVSSRLIGDVAEHTVTRDAVNGNVLHVVVRPVPTAELDTGCSYTGCGGDGAADDLYAARLAGEAVTLDGDADRGTVRGAWVGGPAQLATPATLDGDALVVDFASPRRDGNGNVLAGWFELFVPDAVLTVLDADADALLVRRGTTELTETAVHVAGGVVLTIPTEYGFGTIRIEAADEAPVVVTPPAPTPTPTPVDGGGGGGGGGTTPAPRPQPTPDPGTKPAPLVELNASAQDQPVGARQTMTVGPPEVSADDPVSVSITPDADGDVTVEPAESASDAVSENGDTAVLSVVIEMAAKSAKADGVNVLRFQVHESALPEGTTAANLVVYRDGEQGASCAGSLDAMPDPCIATAVDTGDAVDITINTTHFSQWDVAVTDVGRIAGVDRVGTAIGVSQASFADGEADGAVITRADDAADALSATPLALAVNGPILLVERDAVPASTLVELRRVLAEGSTVHVIGGSGALSDAVVAQLDDAGYAVQRVAGVDRASTAVAVAELVGGDGPVLVASGVGFADSLTAGVAAASNGGVVVLTDGESVPAATAAFLAGVGNRQVFAVGGAAARAVPSATPLAGADRFVTATIVAAELFDGVTGVGVANGERFPDALAAGPLLARAQRPLLLATATGLPGATGEYLEGVAPASVWLFGGTAALGDDVRKELKSATG